MPGSGKEFGEKAVPSGRLIRREEGGNDNLPNRVADELARLAINRHGPLGTGRTRLRQPGPKTQSPFNPPPRLERVDTQPLPQRPDSLRKRRQKATSSEEGQGFFGPVRRIFRRMTRWFSTGTPRDNDVPKTME